MSDVWFDRPMTTDDLPIEEEPKGITHPYYVARLDRYSADDTEYFVTEPEAFDEAYKRSFTDWPYGIYFREDDDEANDELIGIMFGQEYFTK